MIRSSSTDYLAKIDEITAIEKKDLKEPNLPIDRFLQYSENLYHWSNDDREHLAGAGLELKFIDELPVRAGALRESQSLWIKEWNMHQQPAIEWEELCKNADELKKKILQSFDYGYRKDPELLKRVSQIRQGSGHVDTIQDLNDLAVLGKAHQAPLGKINFDMALLDKSAETASKMASLLAIVNGEKLQDNEIKIIRDKAYTFLKEAYDEVRACGKYVFADNPDRLKGYLNLYFKSKKKKKGDTTDENIENIEE